jgi:DNA (cytosine-5)-methyltransferase 1
MTSLELSYATAFTGIGGLLDYTLHRLGWRGYGMVEKDPAAQAVLRAHFPDVPLMGDIRHVNGTDFLGRPTVFAFGFPCTNTSIAAPNRLGLDGDESGLFFEALRLIDDLDRPEWVIIENPEGALESNQGRDWLVVTDSLGERGYRWAYRVVDGGSLPGPYRTKQKRRRALVVARLGDDPRPCWNVLGLNEGRDEDGAADRVGEGRAREGARPPIAEADAGAGGHGELIFRKSARARAALDKGGYETWVPAEFANTLTNFDAGGPARQTHLVVHPDGRVRSFTVNEWERLSGFPDDWTKGVMPGRGGKLMPISDAARQRMCGLCVHLGTGEWLGERLDAEHKSLHATESVTVMTA